MNRMRLIDAEQFITEIEINIGNIYNPEIIKGMKFAIDLIKDSPTVFDKEKVINKLKIQYDYSRKVRNENENMYFEYWDGRTDSYKDSIEIVEKGGIE